MINEEIATELWSRLETLYKTKSLSNKLYLKKQLYGICMNERTSVLKYLSFFNKVISELLDANVKIDEEDKALILLILFPESYNHIVTTILYGKKTLSWRRSRQLSYLMRLGKTKSRADRIGFGGYGKERKRRRKKYRLVKGMSLLS